MRTVKELENEQLAFICDSQHVEAMKASLPISADCYDSFFVNIKDGEYSRVFGMFGIIPWHTKQVYQII